MLKHKNIIVLCSLCLVLLFITHAAWWTFLVLTVFFLGMTSWGSFDIRLNYFLKAYHDNPNEKERRIALTFDDGPHEMTEEVLNLLQKFNAKATFFCIGTQIEKYPDVLKRTIDEGHTVGNHTYSHSNSIGFFSTAKVLTEIEKNDTLLSNAVGRKIKLFRPPFGVTNPNIARAVSKTGHYVIGWNIRSLDTLNINKNTVFERIKKRIQPGGIILLHDTSLKTVTVLERLLLFLQSENYEMVTIDTLLNLPAYEN